MGEERPASKPKGLLEEHIWMSTCTSLHCVVHTSTYDILREQGYGCMCRHVISFVFNVYEYIRGHVHACASMYPCASVCRLSASSAAPHLCDVQSTCILFSVLVSERSRVSERCRQGLLTSLPGQLIIRLDENYGNYTIGTTFVIPHVSPRKQP